MAIPAHSLAVDGSFSVLPAQAAQGLPRYAPERFQFRVPAHWRAPVAHNPFAADAQRHVLDWFASLGCSASEIQRASAFDTAGYVGIPFPTLSRSSTVRFAKYLSLWLLWDDTHVENLENVWRFDAQHVLSGRRPQGMTRFDEGWWQILQEFARARSAQWIEAVCAEMTTWSNAAVAEAGAMQRHRQSRELPAFERQLELRIATIGMYGTVYLLEDAYDVELPREFHEHPTVRQLKKLSGEIVGLGNDILSFGKDQVEEQPNLVSTLMRERGLSVGEATEALIRRHDRALAEYDEAAASFGSWSPQFDATIQRWLQDVRHASLGFSLWEAQAPRYTVHKVVAHGHVLEPTFVFFEPLRSAQK